MSCDSRKGALRALIGLVMAAFSSAPLLGLSADAQTSWVEEVVPPEGLKLGGESLTWGEHLGTKVLLHDGQIVASSYYTPRTYPSFTVLAHWNSAETTAILLQADAIATKDCATFYVIETRSPHIVTSHLLGAICVGLSPPSISRNADGFVFAASPTPTSQADVKQWRAQTGDVVTTEVGWHPRPGTTMLDYLEQRARARDAEPLETAELYAAVLQLPKDRQARVLTALWNVDYGCEFCGGTARKDLYGVIVGDRMAAFSGCGWWLNGGFLNCGQSDALAVWDGSSDRFYFATASHQDDGIHDDASLAVSPALSDWSPVARARFEIWRNGRSWWHSP